MTGTTSITLSTGGGTIIVPPRSETGIFDEFDPASPIHGSDWFPDSSGVKTYTGNRIDAAIAHRDRRLDDLKATQAALVDALVSVGIDIPTITDVALRPLESLPTVEAYAVDAEAPVKPTDIDFSKPANPVITDINPNFPVSQQYASTLLSDLERILDGLINNFRQTGLNPVIEQQIWDKERERTTAVMLEAVDNETAQWARSGWAKPQGAQFRQIQRLQEQKRVADITTSRNIAVAQADLEQKNLQFSIQQSTLLINTLMSAHTAFQALAVEAEAKRITSLGELNKLNVDVFKQLVDAGVAYAEGKIKLYQADADVFETLIDAESKKITAQIAVRDGEMNYDIKSAELTVDVAKANIATLLAQKELLIKGLETEAQLEATIAAAVAGAVHFGSSISGSSSYDNAGPTSLTM